MNELEKVVNDLQNNKAPDKGGMRNEYIKYGGKDIKQNLLILLNEVTKVEISIFTMEIFKNVLTSYGYEIALLSCQKQEWILKRLC